MSINLEEKYALFDGAYFKKESFYDFFKSGSHSRINKRDIICHELEAIHYLHEEGYLYPLIIASLSEFYELEGEDAFTMEELRSVIGGNHE